MPSRGSAVRSRALKAHVVHTEEQAGPGLDHKVMFLRVWHLDVAPRPRSCWHEHEGLESVEHAVEGMQLSALLEVGPDAIEIFF
jgi:hypothetical protein